MGTSQLVYHLVRNSGPYWRSTDQTGLELDTEESIHELKHLCNVDFNFSFTGWWDQVKWEMKTKHFCPCEFLSQNKDTHPPFWWRFSTKYQPGLNLQTTLLSSHPPPVTYHAKATALWFWWPFLSTKVMLTLWAVQAGSLCTNAGVEVPRRWCTVTHPHILYSTFYIQSQKLFLLLNVYSAVPAGCAWQVTDDDHFPFCTWEFFAFCTLVCCISRHEL